MLFRPLNVLFLCAHNCARSIMAEGILRGLASQRFRAFSAGSEPSDAPHPLALEMLERHGFSTEGLHSKSWREFGAEGAPMIDLVITLCDDTRREPCPTWPGVPVTSHWGIADPTKVFGSRRQRLHAFSEAAIILRQRIALLIALPVERLDAMALHLHLKDIGREC